LKKDCLSKSNAVINFLVDKRAISFPNLKLNHWIFPEEFKLLKVIILTSGKIVRPQLILLPNLENGIV